MRTKALLVAAALAAGVGAAAAAPKKDALKKKLSRPAPRGRSEKASTPRLNVDASSFRAAGDDARRSLSRIGEATAGDRRKLGSLFERLGDSLRDAWRRAFGSGK